MNKIFKITDGQVNQILNSEEGHFLDLKSKDITPSKLSKSLSAFANTDGGELYIGIGEDNSRTNRTWSGFTTIEKANSHLQVFDQMFVFGQFFNCVFLTNTSQRGYILKAEVFKTPDIKYATDKKAYVRRGAQSIPYDSPDLMERLKYDKGIISFEVQTVNDNEELITNSLVTIEFLINQIPTAEPEEWLRKQHLLNDHKPTIAGVLLFAEEPQAVLPKRCSIKIYRYSTTQKEGTRDTLEFTPITIEGDLYHLISKAVNKTVEIVENVHVNTTEGLQKVNYPHVTLHEVITNAVLHRDYSLLRDVHIRIFDNRIEVESPGKLPGHVSIKNILQEQFARNGSIIRLK